MNRRVEICSHCNAMTEVTGRKWFCKDVTYFFTGGFCVDSNCDLEQ